MLGSKINNLLILKNKNINVPEFFYIKHDDILKGKLELDDLKGMDRQQLEKTSEKLKKQIEEKIKIKYINNLNCKLYSVRSSASLEDGECTSFAGQFDTYLNVPRENLNKKILECFKSLYNVNVLEYMQKMEKNIDDLKMNIIVQKMIPAQLSGVVFTSNPQGILNESVISVSKGLGDNVVQDKGDITNYYYNLTDKIYYFTGKENLLNKKTLENILEQAEIIKSILGTYLDIEFSIYKNKIYILQARKITTINDKKQLVLDNSNIVESYPGISLPLTCSFVNTVYSGVFKGVCSRILKDEKDLEELNPVFNNMVGNANGRIYYKISNWYTIIKHLPLSNKIIPIWQEMLGIKNKNYDEENIKLSFLKKLKIYINFIIEMIKVPKNMEKLNKKFIIINNNFYEKYNTALTPQELKKIYDDIKIKLLSCWDITLLNDLYAFIFTGLLKKRLEKKYENDQDISNKYISGISNIESLKPIKEMISIAYECNTKEEYEKRKEEFIKIYGDRNLEELKIESETFRTNENLFDNKIMEYRNDKDNLKNLYENINEIKQENIKEDFITKFLIKKSMQGIKNREISRLNRSRIYGIVREIFLSYGKYFKNNKIIETQNDIFYLSEKEIFDFENIKSYKNIIKERKENYKIYEKLPAYSRLIFCDKEFNKVDRSINSVCSKQDHNTLYGIPCSSGIVEAEVLVIDNIQNIGDVKNKILVTKMTDPGWVYLLATAKGIISEKGSLLSHTAIISRELKIPAIVGVNDLLKNIKSKDIIHMDATTGEIKIIKRSDI